MLVVRPVLCACAKGRGLSEFKTLGTWELCLSVTVEAVEVTVRVKDSATALGEAGEGFSTCNVGLRTRGQ